MDFPEFVKKFLVITDALHTRLVNNIDGTEFVFYNTHNLDKERCPTLHVLTVSYSNTVALENFAEKRRTTVSLRQ